MKKVSMIGNAHLDPVWLWQWQEGYQEVKATFRSALDRMKENADFAFTCACADYYRWVEENAPEMFEEIRKRVAEKRWVIVGGMWIQPDMNVPCGESVTRQLLYSQRYFYEKFGVIVRTGYNVDTFGHNGMLPQLLRNAGIENYVWMRPSGRENPDIPQGPMLWEGVDGSRVTAYHIENEYARFTDVAGKIAETLTISDNAGLPMMCFYGVGNHGGGPTRANLAEIGRFRTEDARGNEAEYSDPQHYFDGLKAEKRELPVWKGELQHHASGCYSTSSATKRLHRKTENMLLRAETAGILARTLTNREPDMTSLSRAWQNLMFNEFHDIMGGCCLEDALGDAATQLSEAVSIAAREENAALQRISWAVDTKKGDPRRIRSKEEDGALWGIRGQGTPVVVFNPHSFDVTDTVTVKRPIRSVRDDHGACVPSQRIRAGRTNGEDRFDAIFRAEVPAFGYRLYWVFFEEDGERKPNVGVGSTWLENAKIRVEFDPKTGGICKLGNLLHGAASAKLYDITASDTWAHNIFRFDEEAGKFGAPEFSVSEEGPVRSAVTVTTVYGQSVLRQKYILYADSDSLEAEVTLEMREKQRILKLCFPAGGGSETAEIPYGRIARSANGNEEPCQRWIAMNGLAVINDGKYSYSAENGELRLTAAHTSIFADHYGQDYRDETCRYMDLGELRFRYLLAPMDEHVSQRAAVFNRPAVSVVETYHDGPLPGEYRGISVDCENVTAGAVKRAEDGTGTVLRLAENCAKKCTARVRIPLCGREFSIRLDALQVKTVFLPDDMSLAVREIPSTELCDEI